jgi:electron transfer flavoprotein alpha subunit
MSAGVLILAEARQGELREVSLELVSAAREVAEGAGGRVVVAVIDHDPQRFAKEVAAAGVDEVLTVSAPTEHFEPHVWQRALEALDWGSRLT